MRSVAQIQTIRHLYDQEGWAVRRIARELKISRQLVRKALDRTVSTEEPHYTRHKQVAHPKMDPYQAQIDAWIQQDEGAPRKQRHTAHRIWERLRDELGAKVEESTVRRYVAERRRALAPRIRAFVHLVFSPGEAAQVDWGDVTVRIGGRLVKAHMFCMRLGFPAAPFVMVSPTQRLECFVEAQIRALDFFGGIPRRVIYDNLRSAVLKVLHRSRKLNSRFEMLVTHYGFRADFANPEAGWEKGLVEDLVGWARRSFFVPIPQASSFEELNEQILDKILKHRDHRPTGRGGKTLGELWDEERAGRPDVP